MPHSSRLVDALQSVATQDRSSANHPTDVLRRFTRVAIKNEASLSSMRGFVGPWPGSESAVPNQWLNASATPSTVPGRNRPVDPHGRARHQLRRAHPRQAPRLTPVHLSPGTPLRRDQTFPSASPSAGVPLSLGSWDHVLVSIWVASTLTFECRSRRLTCRCRRPRGRARSSSDAARRWRVR